VQALHHGAQLGDLEAIGPVVDEGADEYAVMAGQMAQQVEASDALRP